MGGKSTVQICGGQAKKKASTQFVLRLLVPKAGVEPALLSEHEFESCASTNSATSAFTDPMLVVLIELRAAKLCFSS